MMKIITAISIFMVTCGSAVAQVDVKNIKIQRADDSVKIQFTTGIQRNATKPNYKLTLTPGIYKKERAKMLAPIIVETRRSKIIDQRNHTSNPSDAILTENGATIDYVLSVPFEKWMYNASFRLDMVSSGCCMDQFFEPLFNVNLKLAPKPIPEYRIEPQLSYIRPEVEHSKLRHESGSAYVEFFQGNSVLIADFRNNATELRKIHNSIELVNKEYGVHITEIDVKGYCSPEGSWEFNSRLAAERASVVSSYLKTEYGYGQGVVRFSSYPEDWELFKTLIERSDIAQRDQILNVINSDKTPDEKDAELSSMPIYGFLMENMYPKLRRVDYKINYTVKAFDLEQSKQIMDIAPKNLSLMEMFMVANSYAQGSDEFNHIFQIAATFFPDDAIANTNAAINALKQGKLDQAAQYLSRVKTRSRIPEYDNAMGVLEILKGDYAAAESYLKSAADAGLSVAKTNLDDCRKKIENIEAIRARDSELTE